MDSICGPNFLDPVLPWPSTIPDFVPCVHRTFLIWIPCVLLWLFAPFALYRIRTSRFNGGNCPWTLLAILRLTIAVLLALLSIADVMDVLIFHPILDNNAESYTPLVNCLTLCYVVFIMLRNQQRGVNDSPALLVFWLTYSVTSLITYRSVIMDVTNPFSARWELTPITFIFQVTSVTAICTQLLLTCFSDNLPLSYYVDKGTRASLANSNLQMF
ncbi:ATP-binding cassette sub-family C member 3 [Halotydeus destructor]|nr:ATP-binding cassette sub-family C member 3 [Halotydeus destructor]